MRRLVVDLIGLTSGIISIAILFVKPQVLAAILTESVSLPAIFNFIITYSRLVILVPLFLGIASARLYGGFSFPRLVIDPLHFVSSFIMFEFWSGVRVGIIYLGYFVIPFVVIFYLKTILG